MPRVGFELTITAFLRAKRVHALDLAATVISVRVSKIDFRIILQSTLDYSKRSLT
jgi:hypothetical protein